MPDVNSNPTKPIEIERIVKQGYVGIARVVKAAGFSMRGLRAAWRREAAFRQECVGTLALTPCAFLVAPNLAQAALLLATLAAVLVAELLNSAVEAAVDRVGDEQHELAGYAKDMGSAAVFVCLLTMAIVWGLVAAQRFIVNAA